MPIPAQHGAQTIKHFSLEPKDSAMTKNAEIGQQQKIKLQKHVLKLGFLCGFDCQINSKNCVLNSIVEKLNFDELEKLKKQLESILLDKNFHVDTCSKNTNRSEQEKQKNNSLYLIWKPNFLFQKNYIYICTHILNMFKKHV